jgi:hypothetical protein
MIGTTRSRVSFFMNKFRRLGFVNYNGGGLEVHSSLLNVVLHARCRSPPAVYSDDQAIAETRNCHWGEVKSPTKGRALLCGQDGRLIVSCVAR